MSSLTGPRRPASRPAPRPNSRPAAPARPAYWGLSNWPAATPGGHLFLPRLPEAGILLAGAPAVILILVMTSHCWGLGRPPHGVPLSLLSARLRPAAPGSLVRRGVQPGRQDAVRRGERAAQNGAAGTASPSLGREERTQIATFSPGGGVEAFSPDGTTLAAAGGPGNSRMFLWDVATRRRIATLTDHHDSSVDGGGVQRERQDARRRRRQRHGLRVGRAPRPTGAPQATSLRPWPSRGL